MSWTHKQPIKGLNAATALDLKSTIIELQDARRVDAGGGAVGASSSSRKDSHHQSGTALTLKNAGVAKRARADEEAEMEGAEKAREALEGKARRYEELMRGAAETHDDGGALVDFDRKAWQGAIREEEPELLPLKPAAAAKTTQVASVRHLQLQRARDQQRQQRLLAIQRKLNGQSSGLAAALLAAEENAE